MCIHIYVILSLKFKKFNLTKQSNSKKKKTQKDNKKKQKKSNNNQHPRWIYVHSLHQILVLMWRTEAVRLELLVKNIYERQVKNGTHDKSFVVVRFIKALN